MTNFLSSQMKKNKYFENPYLTLLHLIVSLINLSCKWSAKLTPEGDFVKRINRVPSLLYDKIEFNVANSESALKLF